MVFLNYFPCEVEIFFIDENDVWFLYTRPFFFSCFFLYCSFHHEQNESFLVTSFLINRIISRRALRLTETVIISGKVEVETVTEDGG